MKYRSALAEDLKTILVFLQSGFPLSAYNRDGKMLTLWHGNDDSGRVLRYKNTVKLILF